MPPLVFHAAADFASKCSGKIRYAKHAHAERVRQIMIQSGKGTLENMVVYKCRYCSSASNFGYHVGHVPRGRLIDEQRKQEKLERDRQAFEWLAPAAAAAEDSSSPITRIHVDSLSKAEREQESREERRRAEKMRRKQRRLGEDHRDHRET